MYIYKTFQHDDEELMDEGLETIDPATILARIRKIVISIRSSLQKTQSFESQAKIVPSDLQVILDVDTRWNSTFAMLERAKRLRVPLTTFAASDKTQNFELGAEDWKRLDDIITLFLLTFFPNRISRRLVQLSLLMLAAWKRPGK